MKGPGEVGATALEVEQVMSEVERRTIEPIHQDGIVDFLILPGRRLVLKGAAHPVLFTHIDGGFSLIQSIKEGESAAAWAKMRAMVTELVALYRVPDEEPWQAGPVVKEGANG